MFQKLDSRTSPLERGRLIVPVVVRADVVNLARHSLAVDTVETQGAWSEPEVTGQCVVKPATPVGRYYDTIRCYPRRGCTRGSAAESA